MASHLIALDKILELIFFNMGLRNVYLHNTFSLVLSQFIFSVDLILIVSFEAVGR
jgi:hypothetical protein